MAHQQTSFRFKKLSGALVATVVVVGGGVISSSTVSAKKSSGAVPEAPTIVSIETKVAKNKKTADLKFTVALPSNVTAKSIALTEVSIGKKKCVMKKAKTSCTIRGVDANYVVYSVTAKTKVSNKFGKASKKIQFSVNQITRKWFNPAYRPAFTVNRSLVAVLGSSSGKATSMQGVRRGARASAMSTPRVGITTTGARLTLNVSSAVAFAQFENSSSSGTGLSAISSTGAISEAFTENWTPSGGPNNVPLMAPKVSKFFVAPNGQIYVQFMMPFPMIDGGTSCSFYSFSLDTGEPTCIDPNLQGMHWFGGWMNQRYTNPGVQFDTAGNVYYMGYTTSIGQSGAVLRKYNTSNGQITELANQNTRIDDFAVLPDGAVIIVGGTNSTGSEWTRVVGPTGALRNIGAPFVASAARFITKFSDGNYYLGSWSQTNNGIDSGVVRFIPSTGTIESEYWIRTSQWNDNGQQINRSRMANEFNAICMDAKGSVSFSNPFCQWGGGLISKAVVAKGNDYVLTQGMGGPGMKRSLMQYAPTLKSVMTNVANIALIESTGTKLIITGTNAEGTNVMSVFDPATDTETMVMDGSNQIEIYSMTYVPALGKVMFSGLRFSDNSYVVGEIAIP